MNKTKPMEKIHGENTQNQPQVMVPVTFSTKNIATKTVAKETPPPQAVFVLAIFLPSSYGDPKYLYIVNFSLSRLFSSIKIEFGISDFSFNKEI